MSQVTVNGGAAFEAGETESLLDATLRAGTVLAYSCRTGRCGTCKCRLAHGETRLLMAEGGLSEAERAQGWILSCSRAAVGDVALQADLLPGVLLPAPRLLPCRIASLDRLASDVLRVKLRLPPNSRFDWLAGQSLDVIGPGGLRRSYSIANLPDASGQIELQIRQVDGGAMSAYWFGAAKANDLLRLHGPLGTFVLREGMPADLVLLATGTGIAPVQALLQQLAAEGGQRFRQVRLYWGGRLPADLYLDPATVGGWLHYTPLLSRADAGWTGARGHVQQVALADAPDLAQTTVMACGAEAMTIGARTAFVAAGLDPARFLSDAFVCSAAAPPTPESSP